MHNTFNLRDTEVVICIISVLFKSVDGVNHYLNKAIVRHNSETIVNFEPKSKFTITYCNQCLSPL